MENVSVHFWGLGWSRYSNTRGPSCNQKKQGLTDKRATMERSAREREKGKGGRKKQTHNHDHHPSVDGNLAPHGERIHKRNHVQQHDSRHRRLVKEQLHRAHLQLAVVRTDPDRVQRAGKDACKRKHDAQGARRLDRGVCGGQAVVVADHADAGARGDQREQGVARQRRLVEDKVHEGDAGRQQDAGDLVEGDAREGERQVGQDDVERHGDGKREDGADGGAARLEVAEARPREDEEREPCYAEMEAGEAELGEFERGVGEDGFVGEDLGGLVSVTSCKLEICSREHPSKLEALTIPTVARVLTTIHTTPDVAEGFGGSGFSKSWGSSSSSSRWSSS